MFGERCRLCVALFKFFFVMSRVRNKPFFVERSGQYSILLFHSSTKEPAERGRGSHTSNTRFSTKMGYSSFPYRCWQAHFYTAFSRIPSKSPFLKSFNRTSLTLSLFRVFPCAHAPTQYRDPWSHLRGCSPTRYRYIFLFASDFLIAIFFRLHPTFLSRLT